MTGIGSFDSWQKELEMQNPLSLHVGFAICPIETKEQSAF